MGVTKMKAIVIGAGFSGAACARKLAENGFEVTVIEKNTHIGGNAYDEYQCGAYVHRYGPHIFHTEKQKVFEFLSRFTEWFPYEHRVLANLHGTYIPVPFNLESLRKTFPAEKAKKIEAVLKKEYGEGKKVPILQLKENPDADIREFADFVFENVFRFYTQKQWGRKIEQLDPAIMRRVPVYVSEEDRYFTDKYQFQPKNGYTALFEKMLAHDNIAVTLGCNALERLKIDGGGVFFDGEKIAYPVIFTGQADELLSYRFGKLPYRSLRFDFEEKTYPFQPAAVVNYTVSEDYTRISEFSRFTVEKPQSEKSVVVYEYPLEYETGKNMIAYYPVVNEENLKLYEKYKSCLENHKNFFLLGRLGNYKYINMDAAVENALALADKIIGEFDCK